MLRGMIQWFATWYRHHISRIGRTIAECCQVQGRAIRLLLRRPDWHALEAASGRFNFGLRSALATSPGLGGRSTILRNVVANYRAGGPLKNAGLFTCNRVGHKSETDNQNAKPAQSHAGLPSI